MAPLASVLLLVSALLLTVSAVCPATPYPPGDRLITLEYDGIEREYLLHVPPNYNHTKDVPLVFALHGLGANTPTVFQNSIEIDAVADREGFIVAYPLGSPTFTPALFGHSWNGGQLGSDTPLQGEQPELVSQLCCLSKHDDIGFIRYLLEQIKGQVCVNERRVYSFGFSAGGVMSHRLACEASDIIRAIASFSGVIQVDCEKNPIVPVLHFHGTLDAIFPYNGLNPLFNGATDTFKIWARVDQCTGTPEVTYQDGRVTEETYLKCAGNATVSLITTDAGGHSWPPRRNINAEEHIWAFFNRHQ